MKQESGSRLLVLGARGMLGNTVLRWFDQHSDWEVFGAVRDLSSVAGLQMLAQRARFIGGFDFCDATRMKDLLMQVRPDVVINCIGVVKQLAGADDPQTAIPVNALFPHRLARMCGKLDARLIHIGTDCVFSGGRGNYSEQDEPDANDLYSRTKLMGEVDYVNAVTLRTSIIGHELNTAHALLGWFLAQSGPVPGFSKALFSALPTVELARVIQEFVIPHAELRGTYHVAGPTIGKYELLKLVAKAYGRSTAIIPDTSLVIDRSLNADYFQAATGYCAPDWSELVRRMHAFG
jgi:dTDP-4-dehydrorhamnose reductase